MKRIVVCDSGLGGLNIAARFFAPPSRERESCELIYFNAYPEPAVGFNKMDDREQERVFALVLDAIGKFSPDLCLIGCNTLSIVYERMKGYCTPSFPVEGIIDAAVSSMAAALESQPESSLLILGTKSTVASMLYQRRLTEHGIAPDRIRSLGVPGLATTIESSPSAPEVKERIAGAAAEALELFSGRVEKLFLGLCCTHYGFAEPLWLSEFCAVFGDGVSIVNPNNALGGDFSASSFSYHSRIGFFNGARENMSRCFEKSAPAISAALRIAEAEPGLFEPGKTV